MTIGIKVTTRAPGLENRRYSGWRPPSEVREEADTLSVALAQPHRRPLNGVDDISGGYKPDPRSERLESVLGRFCANWKPRPLGDHCYQAGLRYAEIIRDYKLAMGFNVIGWAKTDMAYECLTDEQLQARKELAIKRKREADGELVVKVMPRAPRVAEWACYDEREVSPYDEGLLFNVLVVLADFFNLTPRSEMREHG